VTSFDVVGLANLNIKHSNGLPSNINKDCFLLELSHICIGYNIPTLNEYYKGQVVVLSTRQSLPMEQGTQLWTFY